MERAIGHGPTGGSVCQPACSKSAGRQAAGNEPQDPLPTFPLLPARPPNGLAPPEAERAQSSPRPSTQPGLPARGSPAGLTVEVLGCLPPQGLQAHLRVGPLQDQPPAVQVGAVTQGIEGSLWEQGQETRHSASAKTYPQTLRPALLRPAGTTHSKASFSGPCDTCSPARECELLGTLFSISGLRSQGGSCE